MKIAIEFKGKFSKRAIENRLDQFIPIEDFDYMEKIEYQSSEIDECEVNASLRKYQNDLEKYHNQMIEFIHNKLQGHNKYSNDLIPVDDIGIRKHTFLNDNQSYLSYIFQKSNPPPRKPSSRKGKVKKKIVVSRIYEITIPEYSLDYHLQQIFEFYQKCINDDVFPLLEVIQVYTVGNCKGSLETTTNHYVFSNRDKIKGSEYFEEIIQEKKEKIIGLNRIINQLKDDNLSLEKEYRGLDWKKSELEIENSKYWKKYIREGKKLTKLKGFLTIIGLEEDIEKKVEYLEEKGLLFDESREVYNEFFKERIDQIKKERLEKAKKFNKEREMRLKGLSN